MIKQQQQQQRQQQQKQNRSLMDDLIETVERDDGAAAAAGDREKKQEEEQQRDNPCFHATDKGKDSKHFFFLKKPPSEKKLDRHISRIASLATSNTIRRSTTQQSRIAELRTSEKGNSKLIVDCALHCSIKRTFRHCFDDANRH